MLEALVADAVRPDLKLLREKLQDGKLVIDAGACNHCGRCIGKCPFKAVERFVAGYRIYIGGHWGKKTACGQPLSKIFTSEDEVMDVIARAIELFRTEGKPGERFANTVQRLGFDYVDAQLTK